MTRPPPTPPLFPYPPLSHPLAQERDPANPLLPRPPHFAPKAKSCICIYLEGAPSQIDLFDPKPKLNELHGQALPEDRKSTRLNSSHANISYAVFCLKKKRLP